MLSLKHVLIFLSSLAVILGFFAYFAVFESTPGTYTVVGNNGSNNSQLGNTSTTLIASSSITASSSTTGIGTIASEYGTSFSTPPITWNEGPSTVSITGVSLQGTQMTFTMSVAIGGAPQCVPLNLRLVADEQGDLEPPTPASFTFPDSGSCNGSANENYTNATTSFTVDPTAFPLLFTTNSASGTFFEVATSSNNGLQIQIPGTSG
jgi:hypothetical protein